MNNGEKPAMPTNWLNEKSGNVEFNNGLTKREYFAAMALQGMLANSDATMETIKNRSNPIDVFPIQAVEMADELLKQLDAN